MSDKLYADRDIVKQGQEYVKHVSAMTAEGLHEKSDIAAELAHRDVEIQALRARCEKLETVAGLVREFLRGYPSLSDKLPITREAQLRAKLRDALAKLENDDE